MEEGGVTKFRGGQKWEEQKRISGENVGREEGECWEEGRSEKGESWERGDRSERKESREKEEIVEGESKDRVWKAEERSWERIRGGIEGEGEQESRKLLI